MQRRQSRPIYRATWNARKARISVVIVFALWPPRSAPLHRRPGDRHDRRAGHDRIRGQAVIRHRHRPTRPPSPRRSPVRRRRRHECERASGRNAALLSGSQPVAQGREQLVDRWGAPRRHGGGLLPYDCCAHPSAATESASGDGIDGEHSIGLVADLSRPASARLPRRSRDPALLCHSRSPSSSRNCLSRRAGWARWRVTAPSKISGSRNACISLW